jgi:hypothetical protein
MTWTVKGLHGSLSANLSPLSKQDARHCHLVLAKHMGRIERDHPGHTAQDEKPVVHALAPRLADLGRVRFVVLSILALELLGLMSSAAFALGQVGLYDIFETQLSNAKSYSNRFDFRVVELQATFTAPSGRTIGFFGFYDGDGNGGQTGNVWKLRFMPDEVGTWTYSLTWTDGTPGDTGTVRVIDKGLPGPLKIATDNPWYFMDSRGKPFHCRAYAIETFLMYTPTKNFIWEIKYFKHLLQTRIIDRGYNFSVWNGLIDRKHLQPDVWGDATWWLNTTDTKRFNIPAWHAYEEALSLAKDNRVYVITFAGMIHQGAKYNFADFKAFLRYWVARLAPFYNFFGWSPTWEWTDIWSANEVNQIMQYLHDIDPWKRLLSVHDCSHSTFGGWLGFSMRQAASNTTFRGNSRTAGQSQGACGQPGGIGPAFLDMPIIGSEDIWESTFATMPRNATEVRRAAWGIMMAGVMPLYSEWTPDPPPRGGKGEGEPEVRRMLDFFYSKTRYRQYQQLNRLVSSSARQIASGIPGQEYLVYDEDGHSITIDLLETSSFATFSVLWFNPKTGAEQSAGMINGGASRTLTPPFSGDTVLLLSRLPPEIPQPASPTGSMIE